jgi:hypothetical protein
MARGPLNIHRKKKRVQLAGPGGGMRRSYCML